ncbi:MAG TPA: bifunctional DNA primase/polymerase [Tepidisphaeraceae bacterium]|nr:bifunctional DNA primase/polymerase [Tepidisphaeraceae bacterium]
MKTYQNSAAKSSSGSEILSAALEARAAGLSVIPINQEKRPAGTWKVYQSIIASEQLVTQWASNRNAFAVVCGKVSGSLLVLDFDAAEAFESWRAIVGGGGRSADPAIRRRRVSGFPAVSRSWAK